MKKTFLIPLFIFIILSINASALIPVVNFTLDLDDDVYYGISSNDYVYGAITMNDTNSVSYCVSYIKTNDTGMLIQTNPKYTEKTEIMISINPNEDTREFFNARSGIGQVHWTKDNLVIDGRQYLYGVQCYTSEGMQKSEKLVYVGYEKFNSPITRYFWVDSNMMPLMLFFLFCLIASLIIWTIWRFGK